jgi:TonB family protein
MLEGKGLAITALVLGILGLFSVGGLGIGSLVGLALAVAALTGRSSRAGRDVAWAAIAANVFALLTVLPVGAALWAYHESPLAFVSEDDSLPVPAQRPFASEDAGPVLVPLPPPPPPATAPPAGSNAAAPSATRLPQRAPKATGREAEATAPAVPVRVGGEIREPRKTRHVNPMYPREAVAARVQGVVVLECTISPQGKVVAVKILRSVGPLLDESAVAAVKQWEYTPTLLNGVAVPVIMTVTVNFKLS